MATIKAIIFDLDNTIYPVSSIGSKLFAPLQQLIENSGEALDIAAIKHDIQRKPFQHVAQVHGLSPDLLNTANELLKELTYELPMQTFDGYESIKALPVRKFLVTAGYTNLQYSKLRQLGIEGDFEAIYIIDPMLNNATKKSKFNEIATENSLAPDDILVVGDDNNSEIQAARELGMQGVLYDTLGLFPQVDDVKKIGSLTELSRLV